jgi:hypothetical protein
MSGQHEDHWLIDKPQARGQDEVLAPRKIMGVAAF